MKRQRAIRKGLDPKDIEVYAAPPTHHYIICKECNNKSWVKTKYTRLCNDCRRDPEYRNLARYDWGWAHEPALGISIGKGIRNG